MPLDYQTLIQIAVLMTGLLAGVVLLMRGCLSKKSLDNRPIRPTGLMGIDLVIGLMLVIFGMSLAPTLSVFIQIDKENMLQQAMLQLLGQFCMFSPIIIFTIAKLQFNNHSLGDFGLSLHEPTHWQTGVWAAVLGIPILLALNNVMAILSNFIGMPSPEIAHEMLEKISQTKDVRVLILLLTSAIIAAPVFEEFVFRGFMQQTMRDVIAAETPWINICVCSAIFTGIHISVTQWQTFPALFLLGGMLGWMYEKTGSLWPCIILHACFNALNIGIVLLVL